MTNTCSDCGAVLRGGESCQAIFDLFLGLEFSDPAYGEVHMLTVACFMIQHGRYSDEALVWIEKQLRSNLERGVSPEEIRKQVLKETSQTARTWKVTRPIDARPLPEIAWSMTIADVSLHYQDAESYCSLVSQWAAAVLAEMKPLLKEKKNE